jgi:hypothetical protein
MAETMSTPTPTGFAARLRLGALFLVLAPPIGLAAFAAVVLFENRAQASLDLDLDEMLLSFVDGLPLAYLFAGFPALVVGMVFAPHLLRRRFGLLAHLGAALGGALLLVAWAWTFEHAAAGDAADPLGLARTIHRWIAEAAVLTVPAVVGFARLLFAPRRDVAAPALH